MTRAPLAPPLAALALFAALPACHQPIYPPREEIWVRTLARFDDDKDGKLSEAEFNKYKGPDYMFTEYDEDGDGFIDVVELDHEVGIREPRPLVDIHQARDERPKTAIGGTASREGRIP